MPIRLTFKHTAARLSPLRNAYKTRGWFGALWRWVLLLLLVFGGSVPLLGRFRELVAELQDSLGKSVAEVYAQWRDVLVILAFIWLFLTGYSVWQDAGTKRAPAEEKARTASAPTDGGKAVFVDAADAATVRAVGNKQHGNIRIHLEANMIAYAGH